MWTSRDCDAIIDDDYNLETLFEKERGICNCLSIIVGTRTRGGAIIKEAKCQCNVYMVVL